MSVRSINHELIVSLPPTPSILPQMDREIIVRTDIGKPDSLRQGTKILFSFVPAELKQATHPYEPLLWSSMTFPSNSDKQEQLSWQSHLAFGVRTPLYLKMLGFPEHCWEILPGQSRTITSGDNKGELECSSPHHFSSGDQAEKSTVALVNGSVKPKSMTLKMRAGNTFRSIVKFRPLQPGETCVTSSEILLQAYVVSEFEGLVEGSAGSVLTPDRCRNPLFSIPINCDSLPASSTWRLSQDQSGTFRLVNDQDPTLGSDTSNAALARSLLDLKGQLATVLKSLETTMARLDDVEDRIVNNEDSLSDARKRLDHLDRAGAGIEAKSSTLGASLAQAEDRVTRVETSMSNLRTELASCKKATLDAARQLSSAEEVSRNAMENTSKLDSKVHTIDAKVCNLEASSGATREDVSTVQKSFLVTHNRLSDVDSTVSAQGQLLSSLVERQAPTKPNVKGEDSSPGTQATAEASPDVHESIRSLQRHVTELDRRVPVLEAREEKLTRGFGQTLDNLTSVNKFLQTTRQQITGLETRVPVLEVKARTLSDICTANEEKLTGLGMRVIAVEGRAESLSVSMATIREQKGGETSAGGSPAMFPARDTGTAALENLPWLSLPRPLD